MTNPFEDHGIDHLSPSSINQFAASPALFVMERLLKVRAPAKCTMHRGTASEAGIVAGLMDPGKSDEECIEVAQTTYRTLAAFSRDPNKDKQYELLPGMVQQGLTALRPFGKPTGAQGSISYQFEGIPIPTIGYYDLYYEDTGKLVDIKTTGRLASEISDGHARQVAIYKVAISDNLEASVCYITDKKSGHYVLDDYRKHVNATHKIALTMQRFLAVSKDPHELAGIVAPDTEHFFFNDPIVRQNVVEVYGF